VYYFFTRFTYCFLLLCNVIGKILGCFLLVVSDLIYCYNDFCYYMIFFVQCTYFIFFLYKVRCNLGCMLYKILKFLLFFIRFELVGFRLVCSSWTLLVVYVFLFGANRHYMFTTWSPFYCFFIIILHCFVFDLIC
jgi:hypothetical protein